MPGNRAATSVSNTLATVLARSLIIGAVAALVVVSRFQWRDTTKRNGRAS